MRTEDLSGQRFGKLTAVRYIPGNWRKNKGTIKSGKWECKCDCGNTILITPVCLKSRKYLECDICKRKGKYGDIVGKKIGKWTVENLFAIKEHGQRIWKCHCKCECGREKDLYYQNLIKGRTKSCGECYNGNGYIIDLTGQIFGDLTVVGFDKESKKWNCVCACGNTVKFNSNTVKRKINCGSKENHPKMIDVQKIAVGKEFGYLTVTKRMPDRVTESGRKRDYWECTCTCGKKIIAMGFTLTGGNRKNCGREHYFNIKETLRANDRYKDFWFFRNPQDFSKCFKDQNFEVVQLHDITIKNGALIGFCGTFKWENNQIIPIDGDSYTKHMNIIGYKIFEHEGKKCTDILVEEW